MDNYVCRIASLEEMHARWDYNIAAASKDRENWMIWKSENIDQFIRGLIIPYYGVLDGVVICECTAVISPEVLSDPEGLVDDRTAYLSAFRTSEGYRGKGYLSRLFRFMLDDLRRRGYEKVTLGVEPEETENREIYRHLGFLTHIKDAADVYPDGTRIDAEYYGKEL